MADFVKQFATEEELNVYNDEIKQSLYTELGFEDLESLQGALTKNPDEELKSTNETLQLKYDEAIANSEKTLLDFKRDLSKKLGVNLFEEQAVIDFLEVNKKQNETLELMKTENTNLMAEKTSVDVENNLLKVGIQAKRLDRAKSLVLAEVAAGKNTQEAIESLVSEFPEWLGGAGSVGVNLNPDNSTLTEREKYYKQQGYTE